MAETTEAPDTEIIPDNPFIVDGGLSDIDADAAERLFNETQAPPASPEPSLPELEPKVATEATQEPVEPQAAAPLSFRPPAKKKAQSKGLRDQVGNLNTQKTELEALLQQRDTEIATLLESQKTITTEREAARKSLADRHRVSEYSSERDDEVVTIENELGNAVNEIAMFLPPEHGQKLQTLAPQFVERYREAIKTNNAEGFQELVEREFEGADYRVMAGHIQSLSRISERREAIIEKNRGTHFSDTIDRWSTKQASINDSLGTFGTMSSEAAFSPDVPEADSANAVISIMANALPVFKKKMEDMRVRTVVTMAGVRPFDIKDQRWAQHLDPLNPGQLSASGTQMRDDEIFNHQRGQDIIPNKLYEGLVALEAVPILAQRVAELEARLGDDLGGEIVPTLDTDGNPLPMGDGTTLTEDDLNDPMAGGFDHFDGMT